MSGRTRKASRRNTTLVVILATCMTFGYLVTCNYTWWDDASTVFENPLLNPVTWSSFAINWREPSHSIYIPLTYSVWSAIALIARTPVDLYGISLNPAWFHAANVFFHVLSGLTVAAILRRLIPNERAALLGALIYTLHPIQVESVAWISGLKDVLSGFLVLAAVLQCIAFRQDAKPLRLWASVGLYVLALLAKPSAMTAPLVIVLIDLLALQTPWRRALVQVIPYLLLAIPIAIIAKLSQPAWFIDSPLWARPLIALDSIAFYVAKFIFPHPLVFDYGRTPSRVIETGQILYTPVLAIALLALGAWLLKKRLWLPAVGVLLFVAAPAHVLGLVSFEFQDVSTVADHYLYVALLGPAIFAAWLANRYRQAVPVIALAAGVLAIRSLVQTTVWQDHPTLMLHALHHTPYGKVPANNMVSWSLRQRNLPEARRYLELALRNRPNEPLVLFNAMNVYLVAGQDDMAKAAVYRAVGEYEKHYGVGDPRVAEAWVNAGEAFFETLRYDDAQTFAETAARLDPGNVRAQILLAELRKIDRKDKR